MIKRKICQGCITILGRDLKKFENSFNILLNTTRLIKIKVDKEVSINVCFTKLSLLRLN